MNDSKRVVGIAAIASASATELGLVTEEGVMRNDLAVDHGLLWVVDLHSVLHEGN